ncbi:hypothetical protein [Caballeronia sp. LZ035]|uniref:hypothetical protein n=1 Tax=Caballeronia sp. LZ035 TaxID=3038568 RepID=UPI002856C8EB|nr:hypothetical protein [Caballeronia sp. LZ035]MDR5758505.1 hypothetical protein [Caballeronia sp. LZ035]
MTLIAVMQAMDAGMRSNRTHRRSIGIGTIKEHKAEEARENRNVMRMDKGGISLKAVSESA